MLQPAEPPADDAPEPMGRFPRRTTGTRPPSYPLSARITRSSASAAFGGPSKMISPRSMA